MYSLFLRFGVGTILVLLLTGCHIFSISPSNITRNSVNKDRNYKFNYDIAYQPRDTKNVNDETRSKPKVKEKMRLDNLHKISKSNNSGAHYEMDSFGLPTHEMAIKGNRLVIDTFYQRIIVDNREIISVDTVVVSNTKLFNAILSWLGTKYRFGGTTRENVDCSALTRALIVSTFNKSVPRTSVEQYHTTKKIQYKDLKEGDLIFFATHRAKRVSHVGMFLGNDYFIHAGTSSGVTLSSLMTPYWKAHLIGYGRYYFQ